MEKTGVAHRSLLLPAVFVEGGLVLASWLLGLLTGYAPLVSCRFDGADVLLGVVGSLPLLAVFYLCQRWPIGPLRRIKAISRTILRPMFASMSGAALLIVAVLAGIGEEMFFRGFLQAWLGDWLGTWTGLAIVSLFFGIAHMVTAAYAVLAAIMGAYLGSLWLYSGNLLVAIIAHALYDLAALLVVTRRPPAGS